MSTTPVDWLLDASVLDKKLSTLGLPPRRLAMIDSLQELAQDSARMACFLAGQAGDDGLDYDIVEEEIFKSFQAFQATVQKVLHWKDYNDVKQEPLSPWFGAVSSPTPISTPISTPGSSRESSPVERSKARDAADHFALYAPDSPRSDAGYPSREEVYASMAEDLVDDLKSPLLAAMQDPLVSRLPPLLLDDLSKALVAHQPFIHALATEVRNVVDGRDLTVYAAGASDPPSSTRGDAKRARSPGDLPASGKKPCLEQSGWE